MLTYVRESCSLLLLSPAVRRPLQFQHIHRTAVRPCVRTYRRDGYEYFGHVGAPASGTASKRRMYIVGGVLTLAATYYATHLETVPITGRRRFMAVSPAAELQ